MKKIELLIIPNHKIGRLIAKDMNEIAKIQISQKNKDIILLSSKLYYVSQLMYPCFEIENKFNDFDQVFHLLSKYPQGKQYRDRHTKERYIIFLMEIQLISQVALFDRILHLINFVYELGLSDTYVKYEIISKNSRVDDNLKKVLKSFSDYFQKNNIRSLQNKIKHKERLRDNDLNHVSLIEHVINNKLFNGFNEESIRELKEDMKFGYRFYIKDKRKKICAEIEKLQKMTVDILDLLYPLILSKYNNHKKD
jgi:hypothetical protein